MREKQFTDLLFIFFNRTFGLCRCDKIGFWPALNVQFIKEFSRYKCREAFSVLIAKVLLTKFSKNLYQVNISVVPYLVFHDKRLL